MNKMIETLLEANDLKIKVPTDINDKKRLFDSLRTITKASSLSDEYLTCEDEYLLDSNKVTVDAKQITDLLSDNIYIYKGDITEIKADCIVNAANEKMLGCFIPGHHCIDNAIHKKSGLRLRRALEQIMKLKNADQEVGVGVLTSAYNLPSHNIIHIVGPNKRELEFHLRGDVLKEKIVRDLEKCYQSILEIADIESFKTLVICSISTGVYGVNIELASKIALRTCIKRGSSIEKIIINVFSQEDYDVYKRNANQIKPNYSTY
jgi:O-acetyl-ADP-ribose deacetylase (regulator of RNase III)